MWRAPKWTVAHLVQRGRQHGPCWQNAQRAPGVEVSLHGTESSSALPPVVLFISLGLSVGWVCCLFHW